MDGSAILVTLAWMFDRLNLLASLYYLPNFTALVKEKVKIFLQPKRQAYNGLYA